uniref:Pentatricopeptide repeat-containing protein 2 n=1 Tax=Lygus hesperus TaxID=30085 RepID=A0A0K8T303_LYGHE
MWGRNAFTCTRIPSKFLSRQRLVLSSAQNLYSPAALGMNGFEHARTKVKQQFNTLESKFKDKMKEFSDPAATSSTIFTEDLKHMVHLAEESDLPMLRQMMTKFSSQNKDLRFGSFIFGPVVMRMYYFLNQPQEALEAFKDPSLDGFFDQLVTFQVLMDLLLKNEMYDEVLEVFEHVKGKQLQGAKFPKNAVVLAFAACYKKNTPEAHQYAKQLWSDLNAIGHYPMRRAATFAAALAINQNEPGVALEILSTVQRQTYVTVRNLKVCALADLGRPDDALPILRNVLEFRDSPADGQSHTFYKEAITKMDSSVQKSNNPELTTEYESVLKKLVTLKLVIDDSLDAQLCSDIEAIQSPQRRDGQAPFKRDFRKGGSGGNRPSYRPGVRDLL